MSGVQKLQGEDLQYESRKKDQQEQIREWTKLQSTEKRQRQEEENYAKKLYDLKARELDERLVELAIADHQVRTAKHIATKEYNKIQVRRYLYTNIRFTYVAM